MRITSISLSFDREMMVLSEDIIFALAQCFPSTRITEEIAVRVSIEILDAHSSDSISWQCTSQIQKGLEYANMGNKKFGRPDLNYELGFSPDGPFLRIFNSSRRRSIEIRPRTIRINFGQAGSTVQAVKVLKKIQELTDETEIDQINWTSDSDFSLRLIHAQVGDRAYFNPWRNIDSALEVMEA